MALATNDETPAEFLRARLRSLPMQADIPHDLQMINADALARAWGISRSAVYDLARSGLPHVKLGTSVRFPVAALQRWIDRQVEGEQQ